MDIFLKIAIILVTARVGGYLALRFKLPEAIGALLGGILIGPILGIVEMSEGIRALGSLGVVFLLFLAGLETKFEELRSVGIPSFVVALTGVLLPFSIGYWVSLFYGYSKITALFLGGALTATSVGLTASTLMEMNKLHTKEGTTILAAAVIDDILGIMVLAVIMAIRRGGHVNARELTVFGLEMIAYFSISYLLGSALFRRVLALAERPGIPEFLTSITIALILFMAHLAERVQIASITGAYLAGLLIGETSQARKIEDKLSTLAFSLFVPIFLVGIGASTNILSLSKVGAFTLVYSGIAFLTKVVGCGGGALLTRRFSLKESLRIGIGMVPRMEVGLVIANMALLERVFDDSAFAAAVVMTFLTTIMTPPLLKWVFLKY